MEWIQGAESLQYQGQELRSQSGCPRSSSNRGITNLNAGANSCQTRGPHLARGRAVTTKWQARI